MLSKVKAYIKSHALLGEGLYLTALSGGADSVCLLRIMKQLGYRIEAVHCNFRLRGDESDRDEAFCKKLCNEQDIPLHLIHFNTRDYAELHHVSIEMAARELRYSYFEQLRVAIGAEAVVVAHHRDDNIETLFLNLVRGTGIRGLQGMKPKNGNIIRPLLCVSRQEILDYLDSINQTYITDSSNLVPDVKRNFLRLRILPLLKELDPSALDNIQQSIEHITEAVKVYDAAIEQSKAQCTDGAAPCSVHIDTLLQQPSPESTLFSFLSDYGIPSRIAEEIYSNLDAPAGKIWQAGDYTIAKDRDTLIIDKTPVSLPERPIPETGSYVLDTCRLSLETLQRAGDFKPSREPFFATLDADRVRWPMTLRQTQQGDTFQPYGMKGRKLVSDFLTDHKASYFEKRQQLVLVDAMGDIIWLIGHRVSQKVSVSPDTINILSVRYSINK